MDLLIPSGSVLYVRGGREEARLLAADGEIVPFESLKFTGAAQRERGALEDALRAGLFAAPYGRSYYQGVVDQNPGLMAVDFGTRGEVSRYWSASSSRSERLVVIGAGLSRAVAHVASFTHGVSLPLRPARDPGLALSAGLFMAWEGTLREQHLYARAGWLWSLPHGPIRGWLGALGGVGLLTRAVDGAPSRHSAAIGAGPVLGLSTRLTERLGTWAELQLNAVAYRRDDETVSSFAPAAWWRELGVVRHGGLGARCVAFQLTGSGCRLAVTCAAAVHAPRQA